jgi:exodeoxyribonuclease VII large subunit
VSEAAATSDGVILEVAEFYERLTSHLESAFGRRHPCWVRGEIQKVYEKGHLYLDVVDASGAPSDGPPAVLKVRCWQSSWGPLKRELRERGVTLAEGSVISFRGYVGVYKPRGEIGFSVTAIDVEGLEGDQARRRALLIERLEKEGVLATNKSRPAPLVPLRVGLVSSPRTEGFNDFTGQLLGSGFGFDVVLVAATVQGDSAPREVAAAIHALDGAGVDVICIVRGGGSRGDLACFDDEQVARAIGGAETPVMTGIGHTGDVSVADLAAFHAAITPTKLGEHLVTIVADWRDRHVAAPAAAIARSIEASIDEATEYLAERRRTVTFAVRDRLGAESQRLTHLRSALARHSDHLVAASSQRLSAVRVLLAAYDPDRRLRQGWSIVTGPDGRLVRSVGDVEVGARVAVRVADGRLFATIEEKEGP